MATKVEQVGSKVIITTGTSLEEKNQALDWVRANKGDVLEMTQTRRTLEDIFYETVHEGDVEAGTAFAVPSTAEALEARINHERQSG